MTVYEMRTYTLHVGKMAEAVKLYTEFGYPALQKGGQDKKLIGYFQADTGMINQLVHRWKFNDDADRRAHWASGFANKDFVDRGSVGTSSLRGPDKLLGLAAAGGERRRAERAARGDRHVQQRVDEIGQRRARRLIGERAVAEVRGL